VLKAAFDNGEIINVQVKQEVKGGLVALFEGERVFIPASHIELSRVSDLSKYIGQNFDIKLIEYSRERNRVKIVGSRRELLEKENEVKKATTWASLEKGMVYYTVQKCLGIKLITHQSYLKLVRLLKLVF